MEKIDLMDIAKTIKKLGYKVAINGRVDAVFVGNDKNTLYVCKDATHMYYSLICKEGFYSISGIDDEITKENIDKALNSDVWKEQKASPITIEKWVDSINLKFLEDENSSTYETPNKPTEWTPSPEDLIGSTTKLTSMAADSIKLPNKEKARDALLRKMNEAIKEFEDETGVKVTSINGDIDMEIAENGEESYSDTEWNLTTKL